MSAIEELNTQRLYQICFLAYLWMLICDVAYWYQTLVKDRIFSYLPVVFDLRELTFQRCPVIGIETTGN